MLETLTPFGWFLFIVLIIWSTIWKGLALWKSARNNQLTWYIILLIVNTAGILEMIYLLFFSKRSEIIKKAVKKKKR